MANRNVETYDPQQISAVADGADVQGYAEDTWIKISRPNDMWTSTEGCDGQVVRSKSNSRMTEIEITLLQTSPTNDLFSALYVADEKTNAGLFPFFLRDSNGATTFFALQTWVAKMPDIEYGKTVGNRVWTLRTGESNVFVGGVNQS